MKNICAFFSTTVTGIQSTENSIEFCYPIKKVQLQILSNKDSIYNEQILVAKLIDDKTRFKRFIQRLDYYMEEFNGELENRPTLQFSHNVNDSKHEIVFSGNLEDVLTYLNAETALDKNSYEELLMQIVAQPLVSGIK